MNASESVSPDDSRLIDIRSGPDVAQLGTAPVSDTRSVGGALAVVETPHVEMHDPGRPFISESLAALASAPPPPASFLLRGYWPSDAYGVIAAQSKAGKTWIALDIALAVATNGKAFGSIDVDTPGPVLVLLGEGGRRNALRRLQALCEQYSISPHEVHDLHLIYKVPRLSDADEVLHVAAAGVCQILCVTGRDGVHQMWSAIRSP